MRCVSMATCHMSAHRLLNGGDGPSEFISHEKKVGHSG